MRLIASLLLALLFQASAPAHPLHLSITNIIFENGTLNIRMKSFRDDWETGYFHYHGKPVDFTDPAMREIPWFKDYLVSKFSIRDTKEAPGLELVIDTILLEEDAMTIEMHAMVPQSPNSLYIYNALLTDIFPDQTNLVIFEFKGMETGIKFDVRNKHKVVELK